MLKVSVIITTYNDQQYLDYAIQSVLKQSYMPVEIIIIDDGSRTAEAEKIVAKYNSTIIRYFYQKNGGPSVARNYGVTKAVGDYIAFLDADDVWLPNNLRYKTHLLSKYGQNENVFGVYGSFIFSNSNTSQAFNEIITAAPINNLTDSVGKKHGIPGGLPSYLINKKAYEKVGGFDVNLTINEDFDLVIRFILEGYNVCGDSQPGFIRTIRDESLTRNKNHLLNYSRKVDFFNKAKIMKYFSKKELKKRHCRESFSTAKKMLSANLFDIKGFKILITGVLIMLNIL
jgi:glycosyltransferase involved in cell wall biosynthesis